MEKVGCRPLFIYNSDTYSHTTVVCRNTFERIESGDYPRLRFSVDSMSRRAWQWCRRPSYIAIIVVFPLSKNSFFKMGYLLDDHY